MKNDKYESPKLEIKELNNEDVITTSTDAFDGEWVSIGGRSFGIF